MASLAAPAARASNRCLRSSCPTLGATAGAERSKITLTTSHRRADIWVGIGTARARKARIVGGRDLQREIGHFFGRFGLTTFFDAMVHLLHPVNGKPAHLSSRSYAGRARGCSPIYALAKVACWGGTHRASRASVQPAEGGIARRRCLAPSCATLTFGWGWGRRAQEGRPRWSMSCPRGLACCATTGDVVPDQGRCRTRRCTRRAEHPCSARLLAPRVSANSFGGRAWCTGGPDASCRDGRLTGALAPRRWPYAGDRPLGPPTTLRVRSGMGKSPRAQRTTFRARGGGASSVRRRGGAGPRERPVTRQRPSDEGVDKGAGSRVTCPRAWR